MTKEQFIGLGLLIIGAIILWRCIKHPLKGSDILTANAKCYIAGVAFIIIGIMLVLKKGHW